jgi:osmotically-inducible protein OsmY
MAVNVRKKAEQGVKDVAEKLGEGAGAVREKLGEGVEGLKDVRSKAGRRAKVAGVAAGQRVRRARKTVGYRIAGEQPPKRKGRMLLAGLAGAAAAFFLDPVSGKRRRHLVRDKALSLVGKAASGVQRRGRYVGTTVAGKWQSVRSGAEQEPENDQTLAHKVESEVFQSDDIPKGQINVNAENGVIVLRGQVKTPDLINEIERRVRAVTGVRDVRNLLHPPKTPASTVTQTPPPEAPPTG